MYPDCWTSIDVIEGMYVVTCDLCGYVTTEPNFELAVIEAYNHKGL